MVPIGRTVVISAALLAAGATVASAMPLQQKHESASDVLENGQGGARGSNAYEGPGVRSTTGRDPAREATPVYPWAWEQETKMRREGDTKFVVRVENISSETAMQYGDGTSEAAGMSHGVYVVFKGRSPMFTPGQPLVPGNGFEALAEDGNVRPLQAYLAKSPDALESGIFYKPIGAVRDEELWPGKVYEFVVTGDPGDRLAFANMLLQSNDLFFAPADGQIDLFDASGKPISGDITGRFALLDAGTEVNEEPGFAVDAGLTQTDLNTGESESMPVGPVADGYVYPAVQDVLRITIAPL